MGKFKLSSGNGEEKEGPKPSKESAILDLIANEILLEKFPSSDFIEASIATLPSKNTDADFNAFITHDTLHIDIVFGDISLKGVAATILATKIKELIPKENLYANHVDLPDLETIVSFIEDNSFDLLRTHGAYMTLFYGRFDLEKMEFRFIDRGFTKTLIIDEKGEVYFLTSNYLPIGIERELGGQEEVVPIHPNEKWIFYSDGLITVRNDRREHFGFSRFTDLIEDVKGENIQSMQKSILSTIEYFREEQELAGEIILMILKILPKSLEKKPVLELNTGKVEEEIREQILRESMISPREASELELVIHDILLSISTVALKKNGLELFEWEMDVQASGIKILFHYYGPIIDTVEGDNSVLDLNIIQKNVEDVRFGKDLKGRSYIEITKKY